MRPLNPPEPVEVKVDRRQWPVAVVLKKKLVKIAQVHDLWELDTEWWRPNPLTRRYYRVTTESEQSMTIFRNLVSGEWYRQQA
ncbi:MAG: hypothetical protein BZY73_03470 [SAR202 cluster bacterium Casp-Chloro-G3]|nr:MAG: hypothetical protein BZY73_03470 [SAR202 cluster bacterium Casp-Chloro-G3]